MLIRIRISMLIFLLLFAGCGGGDEEDGEVDAEGAPFRVAIVMPSSTTDIAWSQSMFDSLTAVQAEMGGEDALRIAYSEGMFRVTDASAAIRDYAAEGFDLVIAHGAQYGNSVFEVANDFTETSFAWGTSSDTGGGAGNRERIRLRGSRQRGWVCQRGCGCDAVGERRDRRDRPCSG